MTHNLRVIDPADWNRLCDRLRARLGVSYSRRDTAVSFRHPWQVSARFNGARNHWEIQIHAGFVNAAETECPALPRQLAPADTLARLPSGETVVPWLSEAPWLPVKNWRAVGPDAPVTMAGALDPVPPFFAALGVGDGDSLAIEPDLSGVALVSGADRGSRRLLRAVEVVLNLPKPAPGFVMEDEGDGIKRAQITISSPGPDKLPSIYFRTRWQPRAGAPSILEQLGTGLVDVPWEEYHVATVWLLSPPDALSGSDPSGEWVAFPQARLCRNMVFAWSVDVLPVAPFRFRFVSGLAGGAADAIFQNMLAPINEANEAAALALSRATVETRAWSL